MPVIPDKKPTEVITRDEKKKVLKFLRGLKGKIVFSGKVKKAKENLKKAKLI